MKEKRLTQAVIYILLIIGLVIVVVPMIYMISTALKPNGALYEFPPKFFPRLEQITLENFKSAGQAK